MGFDMATSNDMFFCMGAGLIETATADEYNAEAPFKGIISKAEIYRGTTVDSTWMNSYTECGVTNCASYCKLCGADGKCQYSVNDPHLASYDFTNSGPSWIGT